MLVGRIKMTDSFLEALAVDFVWGIHAADAKRPIAISQRAGGASHQPGLGPHTEATTVELVLTELRQWKPTVYGLSLIHISEPTRPY